MENLTENEVVALLTLNQALESIDRLAASASSRQFLMQVLDLFCTECGSSTALLYLVDPSGAWSLEAFKTSAGSQLAAREGIPQLQNSVLLQAMRNRLPVIIPDAAADPRWQPEIDDRMHIRPKRAVTQPLLQEGKVVGAIQIYDYTRLNLPLLAMLANRVATEIHVERLVQASERRAERLKALVGVIAQISSVLDRDQLLRTIIENARRLLNAEACSLFLIDEETGDYILFLASNLAQGEFERTRVPAGKGIIGYVITTGETVNVPNARQDERHYRRVDDRTGFVTGSMLAVPLSAPAVTLGSERGEVRARIIGGMEAMNKVNGDFDDEDADLLNALANQAAIVLEVAQLYRDANQLFFDTVAALTEAIDARDPHTQGHSQRVSRLSIEIARELGLPPETIHQVRVASLLHDIGKIGVPDAILGKTSELNTEEYEVMKQHALIGERILRPVHILQQALPGIADHHERLDKSGYPRGVGNHQISMMGKIIAVADVYDALTSDRPYRDAYSPEAALDYLQERAGTQFDAESVEALRIIYSKGNLHA